MFPPSRLALFCDKFIQAGWLAALIVAPLFFNIYSSRVFEPDKIALIRTLALAMGAMWLVLRAERWRGRNAARKNQTALGARLRAWTRRVSSENPLTLPALFLLLAYLVSTLLSVSPTVSFFGSYQRLQGLYTFSSYLVIFFLAASQIKSRTDIERSISIALVASFPVAFYGIIQHYFVDPLPWVGDVTSRVASNLGNSIFIGAFLILVIPLTLARFIETNQRATATHSTRGRFAISLAAIVTLLLVGAAWGLTFDIGAKPLIEANYSGTLTPQQLILASSAFNIALLVSVIVVALWFAAAFVLKQRAGNFLLLGLYAALLAVQFAALVFSQSRGPLIGMLGGLFTFGVLFALVRGARKLALLAVSAAALVLIFLALLNIPNSPLAGLRELPYLGRLGRVFELEGGTGRVRVLIWQGALQLVVPHEPLASPLTGEDAFNVIRPLVGYGPETMYVAYNKFYPPELGTLESRNATPDRSHNETFDALVTTGLFGFIAENILFLTIFYFALKWLGLMPSARARNLFVALWFGGGFLLALIFGFVLGWEFIGVALPGGMMLGMFAYLVAVALRGRTQSNLQPSDSNLQSLDNARDKLPTSNLWLVALTALFVAHFIEIHFGIAIVSTRAYFWFFAAVFVAIGIGRIEFQAKQVSDEKELKSAPEPTVKRKRAATANTNVARKEQVTIRRISTAPLITFAFLVGFVLAVMGYDYINTNNLGALGGQAASGLDIVTSALTVKNTTAGGMPSFAMLWLFVTTLMLGLGICAGEWGRDLHLGLRDWGTAILLFVVLAFAIFSGLAFYHVLLIATQGGSVLEALLTAVALFTVFMLLIVTVCALSMLFDEPMPMIWFNRTTNYVVLPVLAAIALVLIFSTNVEPIRADMLYKQAASLTGENNVTAIQLYQRALAMQPQQDYYYLFLGRAYLDAAKSAGDASQQTDYLNRAESALNNARQINPYNTDHSANLARLAQARGALAQDPAAQLEAYKQATNYFDQANRLSPNTAHLYDQHAQALLEFADVARKYGENENADTLVNLARKQIQRAFRVDATFCLTFAVSAQAQSKWRARVTDALAAIQAAPRCGDVFYAEGLSIAVNELARAGDEAVTANEGAQFETLVSEAAKQNPTLEVYTTLANFYSKAGRVTDALGAVDGALAAIPEADATTRKRYEDFRFTLVELQKALDAANASPNDVELQRAVAQQWLARGQLNFALPAFQKVIQLQADDYAAQRSIVLLLIATDQLAPATQQLAIAQKLAPESDQVFWQRLNAVITDIQTNNLPNATAQLEELAKSANSQDFALVSALRKLAEKLKGAG